MVYSTERQKMLPYGTAPHPKLPDLTFNRAKFLHIPAIVLVGEDDTLRDSALHKSEKLDKQQGLNRFERGQNWVKSMEKAAQQYGLETSFRFIPLPDSDHSFTRSVQVGGMTKQVFQAFFGREHATPTVSVVSRKNAPSIVSYSQLNQALAIQL